MEPIEELAIRLDRVEAELALHRLVNDYCIGADHRDLARWQRVWTADAVWQTSPERAYRGIVARLSAILLVVQRADGGVGCVGDGIDQAPADLYREKRHLANAEHVDQRSDVAEL